MAQWPAAYPYGYGVPPASPYGVPNYQHPYANQQPMKVETDPAQPAIYDPFAEDEDESKRTQEIKSQPQTPIAQPPFMQPQSAPAQTPVAVAKRIGPWSEHVSDDGKVFYFNHDTLKSVWNKPAEFKDEAEKLLDECDWKEYKTSEGKQYYHNEKLGKTQWEIPDDFRDHLEKIRKAKELAKNKDLLAKMELPDDRPLTKDEAREAFIRTLKAAGMTSQWTQDEAFGVVKNKPEWKYLKIAEKKQIYQSLINDLLRETREEQRKKEKKIHEDFIEALFVCDGVTKTTGFREAMTLISTDPRYLGVSLDRDRERLFNDFLVERKRREQEFERQKRQFAIDRFRKFLETRSGISADTQWRIFKEEIKDDPVFMAVDPLVSLTIFMDHIKGLEHKEIEELKMAKMKMKIQSRRAREDFRELLEEKLAAGEINSKTRWRAFRATIVNDPRFVQMLNENSDGYLNETKPGSDSTPAELFYDLTSDLGERYRKDKKKFKDILKDLRISIQQNDDYLSFLAQIKDHEDFPLIESANVPLLFQSQKEKIVKSIEKSKYKAKKRFSSILRSADIKKDATWEIFSSCLTSSEVGGLSLSDEEKKVLFDEEMKNRISDGDFQGQNSEGGREKEVSRGQGGGGGGGGRGRRDRSKSGDRSNSRSRSRSPRQKRRRDDRDRKDSRSRSSERYKRRRSDR